MRGPWNTGGTVSPAPPVFCRFDRVVHSTASKELPPVHHQIGFIVKSGALDVWKTTSWFRITPKVPLKHLAVTVIKNGIVAVKSGTLRAFATLASCSHDKDSQNPFTLLKTKKVSDIRVPDAGTFR